MEEDKYKAALERAKSAIKECGNNLGRIKMIESIFPELKESEDERIRKDIIFFLTRNTLLFGDDINKYKSWIAWLEKQGEIDKESYEIAEKEKYNFVSGQFIECRKSFNEFKEDTSYWLEYIGNDNYIGRSDNILNEKFHITPRQLFTLFTVEHCPKNDENDEDNGNDERIQKEIIEYIKTGTYHKSWIAWLEKQGKPEDMGEVSDGYHTFNELYYYRMLYNAAFFNRLPKDWVHKSKRHHDGEECFGGGWFIVMANLPTGQISNHYELKDWDLFQIPEKDIADEWDGHTPKQAAERLHKFLLEKQGNMSKMCPRYVQEQKPQGSSIIEIINQGNAKVAADMVESKYKELSHKEVTKKSDKVWWSEEDENEVAILEAYITSGEWSEAHIDRALGIVEELVNKLKSIKDRIH